MSRFSTARIVGDPCHPDDPRHRFRVGRLILGDQVIRLIAARAGGEANARFELGALLHRHLCGDHGVVSAADLQINKYIIELICMAGQTIHCISSVYEIGDVDIEVTTDLAAHRTIVRATSRQEQQRHRKGLR